MDLTTMPTLVWMDTETTGLHAERRPWDIALIGQRGGFDFMYQWFVHPIDLDLENAQQAALDFGKFWDRHPHGQHLASLTGRDIRRIGQFDMRRLPSHRYVRRAKHIAIDVANLTRDRALILGSNPSFDMECVGAMMLHENVTPTWHYHPVDVPTLIAGYLLNSRLHEVGPLERHPVGMKSDDLCRAIGINPDDFERHSAIGDCELFKAAFDRITQ